MKLEVIYGNESAIRPGFTFEAVRQVRKRGVSVAQAARNLDVHENVLRKQVAGLTVEDWPSGAA